MRGHRFRELDQGIPSVAIKEMARAIKEMASGAMADSGTGGVHS
jgi:hypothetical protein